MNDLSPPKLFLDAALIVAAEDETDIASSIRYHVFAWSACAKVVTVLPALFWMKIWFDADNSMRAAVPEALRMSARRITVEGRVGPGL